MNNLPNPFNSGESQLLPDEAAAFPSPQARNAAADIPETSATERRIEEAPASTSTVTVAAGDVGASEDICHIHEIFYFSRKLIEDDHRFVLDEAAFMEAIEPPPLFLQAAQ